jgi:threonylcarbamoyladenosine tRNA methylthiotransferase MtaB
VTHAAQPEPGGPGRPGEGGAPTPLRVHAAFAGCKVSQADSEAVLARLAACGCRAVADPAQADVLLLMTCGVTAEAERSSRQLARRLAAHGRPVVVAGCAAALRPEQFVGPGISVAPATEGRAAGADPVALQMLRTVGVTALTPGAPAPAAEAGAPEASGADPAPPAAVAALPATERDRTRFTLKVQDGCAGRCSYCAVRLARGAPWSLAAAAAVTQARDALAAGCGEIVLSGIDVGAYHDAAGADLAALVRRLVALPGLARLRLSSIEPGHLTADLLEALAHPLVARHLHVPLQSADDGVLAAMRRPYTWGEYRAVVEAARSGLPGLALSTDLIVGFPGEDDDAFARSLAALTLDGGLFERVHVFPYSRRLGTEAATLEPLPAAVVKARASLARAAAARVLVEEQRDGVWRGYSSTYVRYYLRGDAGRGRMVDAVGEGLYRDGVRGRIV